MGGGKLITLKWLVNAGEIWRGLVRSANYG